ncbi:MAG: hypothetical protein ACE5PM_07725 [Candidatus Hydrothermarchaeales archaeon]
MKFSGNIKDIKDEATWNDTAEIKVDSSWLDYFVPLDIKLSQRKQITLFLNSEEFDQLHREVNKCAEMKRSIDIE